MLHAGPSFVLYALLLDPGCCLRAHFELDGQVELEKNKSEYVAEVSPCGWQDV